MGYFSIIYGRIQGARDMTGNNNSPHIGKLYAHNRFAVESLPDTDDDYPYLTRHMFALAHPRLGFSYDRGIIRYQIVHFGACLKVDSVDTRFADDWLRKFEERVLSILVWKTAIVHFEHEVAGERVARYRAKPSSLVAVGREFAEIGGWYTEKLEWESALGAFAE